MATGDIIRIGGNNSPNISFNDLKGNIISYVTVGSYQYLKGSVGSVSSRVHDEIPLYRLSNTQTNWLHPLMKDTELATTANSSSSTYFTASGDYAVVAYKVGTLSLQIKAWKLTDGKPHIVINHEYALTHANNIIMFIDKRNVLHIMEIVANISQWNYFYLELPNSLSVPALSTGTYTPSLSGNANQITLFFDREKDKCFIGTEFLGGGGSDPQYWFTLNLSNKSMSVSSLGASTAGSKFIVNTGDLKGKYHLYDDIWICDTGGIVKLALNSTNTKATYLYKPSLYSGFQTTVYPFKFNNKIYTTSLIGTNLYIEEITVDPSTYEVTVTPKFTITDSLGSPNLDAFIFPTQDKLFLSVVSRNINPNTGLVTYDITDEFLKKVGS